MAPRADLHPTVRLAGRAHELGLLEPRRALQFRVLASEVEALGLEIPAGRLLERTGWIEPARLSLLVEASDEALWTVAALAEDDRRLVEEALASRRRWLDREDVDRLDRAIARLAKLGLRFDDREIAEALGVLDEAALERLREARRRRSPEYEQELERIPARPRDPTPIRSARPPVRRGLRVLAALGASLLVALLAWPALRPRSTASPDRMPGAAAAARPDAKMPPRPAGGSAAALPATLGDFSPRETAAAVPGEIPVANAARWAAPGVSAAAGLAGGSLVRVVVHAPYPDGACLTIRLVGRGERFDEVRSPVCGGRLDHTFASARRLPPGDLEVEVSFQASGQHPSLFGSADLPLGPIARLVLDVPAREGRELLAALAAVHDRLAAAVAAARRDRPPREDWANALDEILADLERIRRSAGGLPVDEPARALEALARAHSRAIHRERYARPRPADEVAGAEPGVGACEAAFAARERELVAWIEGGS